MNYETYEVRVYESGTKYWYQDDKFHRLDGPAIEYDNGIKYWYINGNELTEEQFNQRIKTCEGKVVEIDGKRYKLTEV